MKKISFTLLIAAAMIGVSMSATAQDSGTATSTTTVIKPISITKTIDMNFGNVAVSGTAGTVVLDPAGARTKTGGVTLPSTAGTVSAASFDVAGEGTYTYSIGLPDTSTTPHKIALSTDATKTIDVTTFTSTPSGTGQLTSGAQVLTVGATLNLTGAEAAGTYTSSNAFEVVVNYN